MVVSMYDVTRAGPKGRHELEAALRRVGGQDDQALDLAGTALVLGALDRPECPLDGYFAHLDELASDTAENAKGGLGERLQGRIASLNEAIFVQHGYRGDTQTYEDLQNANLLSVIDRRMGLPVALGILYMHTARRQGWSVEGLNFPGHFLLRLSLGGERAIIDPFAGGEVRSASEMREILKGLSGSDGPLQPRHYAAVENRQILLRLQNNLKLRHLQDHRLSEALSVVESMLMFAPGLAQLWREAGLLHRKLGNLRAAILALEHCVSLSPPGAEDAQISALLREIRNSLN